MKFGLLLDSSNRNLSVGLAKEGNLFDFISYEAYQRQSEKMVPEVLNLLKRNGLNKDDLGWVTTTKGPGSYTGVRIALTIGKTVATALGIPLYTMSSLESQKVGDLPSICLSNARGKRSYIGIYDASSCLLEDTIMDNDLVIQYIASHQDYVVAGETDYLGIDGKAINILENLAKANDEKYLDDSLGAKPIYLKDSETSSLKVVVRPMNSADLGQVMQIVGEAFPGRYEEKDLKYDLLENPFGHMLVAMSGPDIIGFIDFMVTFDSATINLVAVDKKYRGRSVGTRLLGECIKVCRAQEEPADFLTLEVRVGNESAIRFYKKHGFEEIVRKKQYYADGEDAIYMVRSIVNE